MYRKLASCKVIRTKDTFSLRLVSTWDAKLGKCSSNVSKNFKRGTRYTVECALEIYCCFSYHLLRYPWNPPINLPQYYSFGVNQVYQNMCYNESFGAVNFWMVMKVEKRYQKSGNKAAFPLSFPEKLIFVKIFIVVYDERLLPKNVKCIRRIWWNVKSNFCKLWLNAFSIGFVSIYFCNHSKRKLSSN